MIDTYILQDPWLLAAWNDANARARAEYAAHPIASCPSSRKIRGRWQPCDHMATVGRYCRCCALRLRARRARDKRNREARRAA